MSVDRVLELMGKWRVFVGLALVGIVVIEGIVEKETPLDFTNPTPALWVAVALIVIGAGFRLAALGTLRKNEQLATGGVYSICRHPLYLGSTLLFIGIGIILHDPGLEYWYLGLPYIAIFFGGAIIKEERFLRQKFGEQFVAYAARTPMLVPFGRWACCEFSWPRMWKRGGVQLLGSIVLILASIQTMAVVFAR